MLALRRHGFEGAVYPVNARRRSVAGLPAYPDVGAVPGAVDVAIVVIAAERVPDIVEACGKAGVRTVVVGSAGFSELGADGAALHARLIDECARSGVRVLGPNTNGVVSGPGRFAGTFSPTLQQDDITLGPGSVAVVAQSGAVGAALFALASEAGLPVSTMVNTGNELDVGTEEVIERLLDDDRGIEVVLAYVEGFRRADRLVDAARRAAATGTRIVVLKAGTTEAGAAATAAHTANLAGEDRVCDGVLRQLGAIRARSLTQLVDVGRVLAARGGEPGRRVSIATMSGGLGIMLADELCAGGMVLADWPPGMREQLDALLPAYLSRGNPLDVGGKPFFELELLDAVLVAMDRNPGSDCSVLALGGFPDRQRAIAERIAASVERLAKPLYVVWVGCRGPGPQLLTRSRIPWFEDPARCADALLPVVGRSPMSPAVGRARSGPALLDGAPPVIDGRALLEHAGIRVVPEVTVADDDDIPRLLGRLGAPVVAKLAAPSLRHKTELAAVRVGLGSAPAVREAVADLRGIAEENGLVGASVVLQQQVPAGVELLLGMTHDPVFGPVVTLGLGGVLAEALDDVQVRLPLLDHGDVADMVAGLRGSTLLRGYRGRPRADESVIGDLVVAFARLAADVAGRFHSIDLNPVIVPGDGSAPVVVDWLFVEGPTGGR